MIPPKLDSKKMQDEVEAELLAALDGVSAEDKNPLAYTECVLPFLERSVKRLGSFFSESTTPDLFRAHFSCRNEEVWKVFETLNQIALAILETSRVGSQVVRAAAALAYSEPEEPKQEQLQ